MKFVPVYDKTFNPISVVLKDFKNQVSKEANKVCLEEVSDSTVGYQTAKTDREQNAKGFRILG